MLLLPHPSPVPLPETERGSRKAVSPSPLRGGGRGERLFAKNTVHFGTAITDAVDLVAAGEIDDPLLTCLVRVDGRVKDFLAVVIADSQQVAATVDDAALTDEGKATLLADTVDSRIINAVLQGSGRAEQLSRIARALGPVGRQYHKVSPQQRQDARRLRKTAVVADRHADAQPAQIMDGKGTVARCGEAIDAKAGQVDLAIALDLSPRTDKAQALNSRPS